MVGYARSASVKPHKDTGLGATRFVLDIVILFEYFYLLQISQTEHIGELPFVMVVIFGAYLLSDLVKYREYALGSRRQLKRRSKITGYFFVLVVVAASAHQLSAYAELAPAPGIDTNIPAILAFAVLVVLLRAAKWSLTVKRRRSQWHRNPACTDPKTRKTGRTSPQAPERAWSRAPLQKKTVQRQSGLDGPAPTLPRSVPWRGAPGGGDSGTGPRSGDPAGGPAQSRTRHPCPDAAPPHVPKSSGCGRTPAHQSIRAAR